MSYTTQAVATQSCNPTEDEHENDKFHKLGGKLYSQMAKLYLSVYLKQQQTFPSQCEMIVQHQDILELLVI